MPWVPLQEEGEVGIQQVNNWRKKEQLKKERNPARCIWNLNCIVCQLSRVDLGGADGGIEGEVVSVLMAKETHVVFLWNLDIPPYFSDFMVLFQKLKKCTRQMQETIVKNTFKFKMSEIVKYFKTPEPSFCLPSKILW